MKANLPSTIIKLNTVLNITAIDSIHYFELDKNFQFPGERHNYWEMVYVDSGQIVATADDKKHTIRQGEIIFHKPNEFHAVNADQKTSSNVFLICFVTSSPAMNRFRDKITTLPQELKPYINIIIDEGRKTFDLPFNDPYAPCLEFAKAPPFGGLQLIKTALEQLLIYLLRIENAKESAKKKKSAEKETENRLTNEIVSLLRENIYGKITMPEICEKLSYSKAYISKVFSENMGQTIIAYYTSLKIKEAKKLIRERMYSLTEISNMLHFSDPHYFSRVFKKETNMSPRAYLKSVTIYTK